MAIPTQKTRRRELDFANDLAKFAARSPDPQTKREIYSVVRSIRQRHGFTWEQKVEEVWRVLKLGASTQSDVLNETRFRAEDVSQILAELETQKKIEYRTLKRANLSGRPPSIIVRVANEL